MRIRRPDREVNSFLAADCAQLRAEFFVKLEMISLGEQVQIHLAHNRSIAIRIAPQVLGAVPAQHAQAIIAVAFFAGQDRAEKSILMNALGYDFWFAIWQSDAYFARIRPKNANDQIVADAMRTENAERIGMGRTEKRIQFVCRQAKHGK